MKLLFYCTLLSALFFSPLYSQAQQTSNKSLLWRITGKGLQKPSYLYGTMHLKDRRLFFFTDSVYKNIENADGFAMELDPDEMMDSLFSKMGEGDTTTLLRKLLDEKKFKTVAKKLEKKFGMPADKISRKEVLAERQKWISSFRKNDDMQSVVDMYLYNIAHKQGKWVGGIEDVNDQLNIKDELGKDIDISEAAEDQNDDKRKNYLEKMISIYADQDIDKIDELFSGEQFKKTKDLLLLHRNVKMAQRMDSLAHIRNSFFAVGVAHLPGEGGVIQLLQKKGFTVEPVFSSKKIAPEKYTYASKEIPWVKFAEADSAYTIEMPGKPSNLKAPGTDLNFKVYADLVTNVFYMSAYTFVNSDENPEASIERISKSFFAKGFEKNDQKKIVNNGVAGMEFMAKKEKVYYRFQIYPVSGKIFMLMEGSEKSEDVYSKNIDRFLASFSMNKSIAAKPNTWVDYKDETKAFDVSFPKKPGIDKLKSAETGANIETSTYTVLDIPNNSYYMVVVSDTKKGFVMNADSVIFAGKMDYYKQLKSLITDVRYFTFEGNNAISFEAQTNKDGTDYVSKLIIICRGNRNYTVAVVTQKGREDFPDVSHFLNSFKLNPFKKTAWSKNAGHENVFNTWSPSSFEHRQPDTTGLSAEEITTKLEEAQKQIPFIAHEPYSATSYNIDIHPLSKYYWAKTDSSFFASQLAIYFSDTSSYNAKHKPRHFDSLIYKKPIQNGSVRGYEILVKNASELYYKRVRILPHGDSAYHLFVLAPYEIINDENNKKFFEDFRFSDEQVPSQTSKNKTAIILADLESSDSAIKSNASAAFADAVFDSTDLPLLYTAYLKKYPVDSNEYKSINEKIAQAIETINGSSIISFVRNNYISGSVNAPELKFGMLGMLAKQQTMPAMNLIKELLLKSPPAKGNANPLMYKLGDSLLLCKTLFPETAVFFSDSLLGPGMIKLAVQLIDSNLLQKDVLLQNKEGIFHMTNVQLQQLKKDGYPYFNSYIIDALGKLNDKPSIDLLNRFVKLKDLDVKENAVMALLKIKQPVLPLELHKLAADKSYRLSLYHELVKIGQISFFPQELLTQQLFAETYVNNIASDDDEDDAVCKFIEERTASVKGVQKRYILFKVSVNYSGETNSHLAICGPFDINRKNVLLKDDQGDTKIFYDDKYSVAGTNKLYKDFIAEQQNEKSSNINQ